MTAPIIDPYAYPPRGLDRSAAARYVGLRPDAFDALVQSGMLPRPRRLGEASVWSRMDLDAAFDAASVDSQGAPGTVLRIAMPEPEAEHPRLYAPTALAKRWKCSNQVIAGMIKRGDLPACRISERLFRIRATDVIAYEAAGTIKPSGR